MWQAALASVPPTVTVLLLLRGWSPLRAGLVVLGVTVALVPSFAGLGAVLPAALGATAATGAEVCLIMFAGMLLYELLDRADSHRALGDWLAGRVREPSSRILLVCLGLVPFVESIMGFGVGFIVGYPLLRSMGFPPAVAATVALLGIVTVPWGAMGPGTMVAARLSGVSLQALGENSATLSLPVFFVCGLTALVVGVGWRRALARWWELPVAAGSLWLGIRTANHFAGTPPAGVLGSPLAIAAMLLACRRQAELTKPGPAQGEGGSLGQAPSPPPFPGRAVVPYGVLAALLLVARGILSGGPAALVQAGSPAASAAGMALVRAVAASPAPWLVATCACTPLWFGLDRAGVKEAVRRALARWGVAALTTVVFLGLGNIMRFSGMASALATAASRLGPVYVAIAPWVGGLGGFVTGSNAGANAMFAAAQAEAAARLGYPAERLVAFQNVSASLLTMGSASRLALVAALVDGPVSTGVLLRPVLTANFAALAVLSGVAVMWR